MTYWLVAMILAGVATLPLDFGRRWWLQKWGISFGALTLIFAGINYLSCPQFVGPFWGAGAAWMVIFGALVNVGTRLCIDYLIEDDLYRDRNRREYRLAWVEQQRPDSRNAYHESAMREKPLHRLQFPRSPALITYIAFGALVLLPLVRSCAGCNMFRAGEYKAFVGGSVQQGVWTAEPVTAQEQDQGTKATPRVQHGKAPSKARIDTTTAPVDPAHIRMVDENQAQRLMRIALGQSTETSIGSRYQIGELTVQRVGGELYWVAPLEFAGFTSWQSFGTTPGYLIVSAMDPGAQAQLVTNHHFRYMRSAYFGDNLQRYIWEHGYATRGYMDYSFELDDQRHPYWVVTLYHPTISYWGERIEGCLVINPETGAMREYDMRHIPAWVDRVIPQSVAAHRMTDYGVLIHGWWNAIWGKRDLFAPTDPQDMDDLWLVWGADGQPYWFTGLSSLNQADNSLIGFALMSSRTGVTRIYHMSGSDEIDVLHAVNAAVSNFQGYRATQPILYNIYGSPTWAVPVITEAGVFQRIAFVHGPTGRVALGTTREDGLATYRRLLETSGGNVSSLRAGAATIHATKVEIVDIGSEVRGGNTVYYLNLSCQLYSNCQMTRELNGQSQPANRLLLEFRVFTATSELSPALPLVRAGDQTDITFIEGGEEEAVLPLTAFSAPRFPLRPQPPQFLR